MKQPSGSPKKKAGSPKAQPSEFSNSGHNPVPAYELQRLHALQSFNILDSDPEEAFDALTRLASYICQVPISLITLLDSQRQWFKSRLGLSLPETPRSMSFCQYAIMQGDVFEVKDAHESDIFINNPLVTSDPKIRYYAGAPLLTSDGYALGTLCVIDTVPRSISDEQKDALQTLANEVVTHLELRRARQLLVEKREKMAEVIRIANSPADAVLPSVQTDNLFIKSEGKLVRIHLSDLLWVEALGDYVNLHTEDQRYTVHSSLKEIESKLDGKDFMRVHRGFIVRLSRIISIEDDALVLRKKANVNSTFWRNGHMHIPIGNSYRTALMQRLNLL